MPTLNNIMQEIRQVPNEKLEEVYKFVKSLNKNTSGKNSHKKDLMSYAGSWKDMNDEDFKDFIKETKRTRKNLFSRKIKI